MIFFMIDDENIPDLIMIFPDLINIYIYIFNSHHFHDSLGL